MVCPYARSREPAKRMPRVQHMPCSQTRAFQERDPVRSATECSPVERGRPKVAKRPRTHLTLTPGAVDNVVTLWGAGSKAVQTFRRPDRRRLRTRDVVDERQRPVGIR